MTYTVKHTSCPSFHLVNLSAVVDHGSGNYSSILGANVAYIGIGSGWHNTVTNSYSFIGGGYCNNIRVPGGFIGGGACNSTYSGGYGVIGGGRNNHTYFEFNVIGGGESNYVCPIYAAIVGGSSNCVFADAKYGFIGDGFKNCVNTYACFSFIGNGNCNTIGNGTLGSGYYSSITGGKWNTLNSNYSFIGGGGGYNGLAAPFYGNVINLGANYSSIVGGRNHVINARYSFIGGGGGHAPSPAGADYGNRIYANANYSFIGSGRCNYIGDANGVTVSNFGVIGGGYQNRIDGAGANSAFSTIGGGELNSIWSNSQHSFIGGGRKNYVGDTTGTGTYFSHFGVIGGGLNNCIDATSADAKFGVIGGGYHNVISPGTLHGSIFSGLGNTVSGNYSSILGGTGNNVPNAYQWAGVFGCNVTANTSCAFHANQFVSQNTPVWGTGSPGSFMCFVPTAALIAAGIPPTAKIVLTI